MTSRHYILFLVKTAKRTSNKRRTNKRHSQIDICSTDQSAATYSSIRDSRKHSRDRYILSRLLLETIILLDKPARRRLLTTGVVVYTLGSECRAKLATSKIEILAPAMNNARRRKRERERETQSSDRHCNDRLYVYTVYIHIYTPPTSRKRKTRSVPAKECNRRQKKGGKSRAISNSSSTEEALGGRPISLCKENERDYKRDVTLLWPRTLHRVS